MFLTSIFFVFGPYLTQKNDLSGKSLLEVKHFCSFSVFFQILYLDGTFRRRPEEWQLLDGLLFYLDTNIELDYFCSIYLKKILTVNNHLKMKGFRVYLLLILLLLLAASSAQARMLQQQEEQSKDIEDQDIDAQQEDDSTINKVDFGRPLTNGTDMNEKPNVWDGMKFVQLTDVIVGQIPVSTKQNPKEVTQKFTADYEGQVYLAFQYFPVNYDRRSTFIITLNGVVVLEVQSESENPFRDAVKVTLVKGENVISLRAQGNPENASGIYINEIGIFKAKEQYEQVQTEGDPLEDDIQEEPLPEDDIEGSEDGEYDDEGWNFNEENELYCVASGACHVSYTSVYGGGHFDHYWLDYTATSNQAWVPSAMNKQQWIQAGSTQIGMFTQVIIQGRGDEDQWVETFKISYTTNGKTFHWAENGKIYEGSYDRNTKNEIDFKRPIKARTIRIHPVTWHGAIALRFDVVVNYETNQQSVLS